MAEIKELKTKAQAEEAEFEAFLAQHRKAARQVRRILDVYISEGIDEDKAWKLIITDSGEWIEYD